ncbi:MAG: hypothetical protein WA797_00270, partial [Acidimicrobiales bacterium]
MRKVASRVSDDTKATMPTGHGRRDSGDHRLWRFRVRAVMVALSVLPLIGLTVVVGGRAADTST